MGEYGPEKKRKDGTFLLKTDYNMYGISHIVTKAAVSYISIDSRLYIKTSLDIGGQTSPILKIALRSIRSDKDLELNILELRYLDFNFL